MNNALHRYYKPNFIDMSVKYNPLTLSYSDGYGVISEYSEMEIAHDINSGFIFEHLIKPVAGIILLCIAWWMLS